MKIPGIIALGAAGSILVPVIAEAISVQLHKKAPAKIIEQANGTDGRLVVAFPAFANSSVSIEEFMAFFGSANALLVNYSSSGHDSKALFRDIVRQLDALGGDDLVVFGVSFGAGVALQFRRFLQKNEPQRFKSVRFILYSPVTSRLDLRPKDIARATLGFILHGGLISNAVWSFWGGSKQLHGSPPPFGIEISEERLAKIHESIDELTLRLLSSEARAILAEHQPPRPGEFRNDAVLVISFQNDHMMRPETPARIARACGSFRIVELKESGHADIYRLRTLGAIMRPEIEDFLRG